ncbi:putative E3 ubiquitin ligase [Handroanthus impetiginosus]|uniref:Putative E3 ubiquitin ligase n=1 Tax=Handroanthus impetiginosus TaxID=429701 RepID=A0A2G9GXN7_9LAMI|nr:putative E3 ubiquitin ligase [Handroanthus impetiginosus]
MFNSNNRNIAARSFRDNRFQSPVDLPNLLQLSGNLALESRADPINYLGNNKICQDEVDLKAKISNQNPVSTGLRLSYDDDERNSSITSGSMKAASSVLPSLSDEIRREVDQQKEELDNFLRSQEQNMMRGLRDINQRQMTSFLTALEKTVVKKLHEKDVELETVARKNKELSESIKNITTEAQNWCHMAKYNESLVNVMKTNLQQVIQDSNRRKRVQQENDVDDAASCIDPKGPRGSTIVENSMICKSCKKKGVSVLLMPCRHLCLCRDCEGFVSVCPLCQMVITTSFEVYLS